MRVTENLYVYFWKDSRQNNCNSIFIHGKAPILIDPGHKGMIEELFLRIREDGMDPFSVKLVICTHGHPDHCEAASRFDHSVKITMSRREETYIREVSKALVNKDVGFSDHRVDLYLKEGDLIVGKHELHVISTPGHTPGGISIYWPKYKILFPGDTIFLQGVGRTDLPGGDPKELAASVAKLAKLPLELIVPGHGSAVQGAAQIKANFEYVQKSFA
jgi:hydroxyacylglutathione hydrolase